MEQTEVSVPVTSIIEAMSPFYPDDGHKGTFLILQAAGLEQATALKLINRKYRSLQNWRATDTDFDRLYKQIPDMALRFGGEARVLRTALLDISIIEAGIGIFKRILNKQPMNDGQWAYAVKMAGLRVPMMGAKDGLENPWEKLANAIQTTMSQKEVIFMEAPNGTKTTTARELVIQPSPEQRQIASEIVQRIIQQAQENGDGG